MVRSEQQISCYLGDLAYALCKMYIAPVVSPFTVQNRDVVLNLVTEISQFDGSHESYPRIGGSQRSEILPLGIPLWFTFFKSSSDFNFHTKDRVTLGQYLEK